MSDGDLLKSAVKCLESDSKDKGGLSRARILETQSGGIMIMVDKVFCLSKGNDPRELAMRDLQGQEKNPQNFFFN